jgi:hypothetical protein
MATGTKAIALRKDGMSRMIASGRQPAVVTHQYNLSGDSAAGAHRRLRHDPVWRRPGDPGLGVRLADNPDMTIDLVLEDRQLRHAMLIYGRNVFFCRC